VNIRVPMQLLRAGVRLASLIPAQAHRHLDEALSRHGVPLTLSQIKPENLVAAHKKVHSIWENALSVTPSDLPAPCNLLHRHHLHRHIPHLGQKPVQHRPAQQNIPP